MHAWEVIYPVGCFIYDVLRGCYSSGHFGLLKYDHTETRTNAILIYYIHFLKSNDVKNNYNMV